MENKQIHVLGLGPVGLATTWELLNQGHRVHAFDISPARTQNIIHNEYDFPEIAKVDFLKCIQTEKLKIHKKFPELHPNGNIIYICVGTPVCESGIDLSQLDNALELVASKLQTHDHIVVRSTLQPGCMNQLILKFKLANSMVSYFPEFLRELHIIEDTVTPPLKISCHNSERAKEEFLKLHENTKTSINNFSDIEMVKVASNLFHALKVTFANEILRASKMNSFNAHFVMDQLKTDRKLNISELYLNPGQAFAGHCLEKDLTAFLKWTHQKCQNLPLIQSILDSNNIHKKFE